MWLRLSADMSTLFFQSSLLLCVERDNIEYEYLSICKMFCVFMMFKIPCMCLQQHLLLIHTDALQCGGNTTHFNTTLVTYIILIFMSQGYGWYSKNFD